MSDIPLTGWLQRHRCAVAEVPVEQGAAIAGSIPVVQYLLTKKADVNGRPAIKDGRTAIEGAAEHGRLDMVQLLLSYGSTGDVVSVRGFETAIDLARKNGHSEIVKLLSVAQQSRT